MPEPQEMMKRQQVLAAFGEFAIRSENLDEVLTEACRLVGEATGTGRAKVLQIDEDQQELLVRAGVGWAPDVVGKVRLQMSDRSSETYAIRAAKPVVSQDISKDDRFEVPDFMRQAGVVALVNVPIFVPGQHPYGVLQVDDTRPRAFGDDEVEFLRTYATILGPVIDRLHLVEERAKDREQLRASETRHRLLLESWAQAVWEADADGVVVTDSPSWRAYTGQTLDEWLGYGWLNAIHPDDRAYAEQQWRQAITARGLVNAEFRLRAPHGGWRWTNVRSAPVLDEEGRIVKWAGMNIDIDGRRRAEAALRERERDLARVQRIGGVGGLDVDVTAGLTSWRSPEYLRLHGLAPDASAETHAEWRARVHPDDVAQAERTLFSALQSNVRSYEGEYRITRPSDGETRWIAVRADIERDSEGNAVRLVGAHVDVTEQKRVQEALRESEERLRQFGEASQDVLWIRSTETLEWTYLTPAFETIYGVDRKTALRGDHFQNWLELILPDDREHAQSMIHQVIAGTPVTFEYRIRRPHDGEIRWLRDTDFPIRDRSGRVASFGGSGKDVTSIKLAEELLATSEERLRSAAEVAKFALWDWDLDSDSVVWSDEHFRMQGYTVGEVQPSYRAWLACVHPDDRRATEAAITTARDSRSEYIHEFRALHPDGSVHWLSARARFFYDGNGSPVRMVGAMLDTTDRREGEERQKVLLAELQHRVRNILTVIRSIVSRSNDGERSTDDYVQHLQGRLSSLARTQVLLTRKAGAGVDLENMIRDELVAQATKPEQFVLNGPSVQLSAKAAEVLSLAIHELATNATKYGAFSKLSGKLHVSWEEKSIDGEIWLILNWIERGVAIVDAVPRRQGFGTELISRRIPYELEGRGDIILTPGGLRSTIEFPLRQGDSILQSIEIQ